MLEVGCGTGTLALEMAALAGEIDALDISSEMVRIARKKAEKQGISNVTFHVGTLEDDLPFEAESYDMICAYSILHLVRDRPAVLARLMRLLKPGGSFVASTVCIGDTWIPWKPVLAVMRWLGKAPPVHIVREEVLTAELSLAGLVDIQRHDVGAKETTAFHTARKPA